MPYQEEISQFLADNYASPSSLPKLPLRWTISNRTMSRLRPGYYGDQGLPVIPEAPYETADFRFVPYCLDSGSKNYIRMLNISPYILIDDSPRVAV